MSCPKICVCSISDRPILSEKIYERLASYCKEHSYELVIKNESLDASRHIAWSKIKLLMDLIDKGGFDYYVWIDDDIVITNTKVKLESFINVYQFDTRNEVILLSKDVVDVCPFNSGFLIVKPNAKEYLHKIWKACSLLNNPFRPNWEQDAMIWYYRNISSQELCIIPHKIMQSFYRTYSLTKELMWTKGDFAAHITGMPLEHRLICLKSILRQLD